MNKELHNLIMGVVENQLRDNDPPETRQVYEGIKKKGFSSTDAKKNIAYVVSIHMFEILKNKKEFDKSAYIEDLNKALKNPQHFK